MAGITVTFHHAECNAGSQKHNRRDKEIFGYKNNRIDINGDHESWIDEPANKAYEKIFSDSVKEFNQKQIKNNHPDRIKKNYFQEISNSKKQNVFYEYVFQIGNKQNQFPYSEDDLKNIYKEFLNQFQKQNPNMYVCGAYYHADEQGVAHVHLDIIPIAHNKNGRGMPTYTGIKKALIEQGVQGRESQLQAMWAQNQQKLLEDIARYFYPTLEIVHPFIGQGSHHASREAYVISKQAESERAMILSAAHLEAEVIKNSAIELTPQYKQLEKEKDYFAQKLNIAEFFISSDEFNDFEKRAGLLYELEQAYKKDKRATAYTLSNGETLSREDMATLYQKLVDANDVPLPDVEMLQDLQQPMREYSHGHSR